MGGWINGWMDAWEGGLMGEWVDGWVDGWMGGWALQLRVSFGLLNNRPPFLSVLHLFRR
jgi:hypothetical protein